MSDFYKQNQKHWDEKARIHATQSSNTYNIEEFLKGKSSLLPVEQNLFKNVKGKKVLHVMCHIGFDSISIASLGADVTAVDFSHEAISQARKFSDHLQVNVNWVQSNIFDLPNTKIEQGSFDFVYASYGVICWIDNFEKWVKIISSYLKPGGMFILIDDHPYISTMETDRENKLFIKYNYFKNNQPFEFINEYSYTGKEFPLEEKKAYEWNHSIDEMISSCLKAQLTLTSFYEYDFTFWQRFSFLTKSAEGYFYYDVNEKNAPRYRIPLMFSLTAIKH